MHDFEPLKVPKFNSYMLTQFIVSCADYNGQPAMFMMSQEEVDFRNGIVSDEERYVVVTKVLAMTRAIIDREGRNCRLSMTETGDQYYVYDDCSAALLPRNQ